MTHRRRAITPIRTTRAYPDSALVDYTHAAHSFTANLPAGATILIVAPVSVAV
jgi:phage baseplate assembly protein gpV